MLKHLSWWRIVKSLAFAGGASSTKWVYLACAAVVNACLVLMTASLCWEYVHHGEVNITLAALIGSTIAVVVAIPANSANQRRQLNTQAAIGQADTTTAATPLTNEVRSVSMEVQP
jgi:hypothetical protein